MANFQNKLVIVTGGNYRYNTPDLDLDLEVSGKTFALEIENGKWKDLHCLPSLKTPRHDHSSCSSKNTMFVIGGNDTYYN